MTTQLMGTRILVPLDGSSLAERALPVATQFARTLGASLVLARILPLTTWAFAGPSGLVPAEASQRLVDEEERQATDYLAPIAAHLREQGITTLVEISRGPADICLVDLCSRFGIGLIVMTSRGRTGMARLTLGSVADYLVRYSQIPVLLVRPFGSASSAIVPLLRALVALDGSEVAEAVLPLVEELAGRVLHEITLVRVVARRDGSQAPSQEMTQAASYLDQVRARLVARIPQEACAISCQVLVGKPADTLIQHAARHGDILMLATRGASGPKRWMLGSVADALVRGASTSLLLLHPELAAEERRSASGSEDEHDTTSGGASHHVGTSTGARGS